MSNKIRLAFAMGGGVSLGTFSGAALTETIKQFIVNHPDKDIEIDVFSGASAGAISLCVMLRIMASYKDKLFLLHEIEEFKGVPDLRKALENKLENEFGEAYRNLSSQQKEKLFSVQVAQEFQKLLWCYKAEIKSLVGIYESEKNRPLHDKGSLLDRDRLLDIAREAIIPSGDNNLELQNENSPLAQRVLFANTLTRIDPIEFGSSDIFCNFSDVTDINDDYQKIFQTVAKDGTSSKTHKDVRVFDINFRPVDTPRGIDPSENIYPNRWLRAHDGEEIEHLKFDVTGKRFWSTAIATSLACGAFPFAFEQVLLTRYAYEYGGNTAPTNTAGSYGSSNQYGMIINGVPYQQYTHSYIDGGTFNNEPISEAFRLASFMDTIQSDEEAQRYVIFVDPFLSQKSDSKIKDFYRKYFLSEETQNMRTVTGLQKMLSFVGPMIGIMRSEGSISELDKSVSVLDKFEKRRNLRKFFSQTIDFGFVKDINQVDDKDLETINEEVKMVRSLIYKEIRKLHRRATIPEVINLPAQVRRLLIDPENAAFFDTEVIAAAKRTTLDDLDAPDSLFNMEGFRIFFSNADDTPVVKEKARYIRTWVKCLYFISLDLTMDLIGKDEKTKLIPIGPIRFEGEEVKPMVLAGQPLEAFIGFFDLSRRLFDFNFGLHATRNILHGLNLGPTTNLDLKEDANWQKYKAIKASLIADTDQFIADQQFKPIWEDEFLNNLMDVVLNKRVKDELIDNLKKVLDSSGRGLGDAAVDTFIKGVINLAKLYVTKLSDSILAPPSGMPIELRIRVTDKKLQLDNLKEFSLLSDRDISVSRDGTETFLLSAFPYLEHNGKWQDANFIKDGKLRVVRDRSLGFDKFVAEIPLPDSSIMEAAKRLPYPVLMIDLAEFLETNQANWEVKPGMRALEQEILGVG